MLLTHPRLRLRLRRPTGNQAGGTSPCHQLVQQTPLRFLVAVFWGLFASPQARVPLSHPLNVRVQVVFLLLPAVALFDLGGAVLTGGLTALVVTNAAMLEVVRD